MTATDIADLGARRLDTLSGGQRQRVWLAMVLAQDTPVICLDEPINHLDLAHQIDCLDLVQRLNRDHGKTIIVVLHDLNLATRYADHLVVMKSGQVYAAGRPEDLVTEDLIQDVFAVGCRVITCPVYGSPLCIPLALSRRSADH
jgi:iron complex transport system ATP-binding protein